MTILNDVAILGECIDHEMITPYERAQVRRVDDKPVISYGLSSFGYDARVADEFILPGDEAVSIIDPKNAQISFAEWHGREPDGAFVIPPNTMALARTVERFKIPDDVVAVCMGKSTYARCGLIVNVTPLEPGWEGYVTLELSNTTPLPVKVYPNEGIAQFQFHRGERPAVSYNDRGGKYQNQPASIVMARV